MLQGAQGGWLASGQAYQSGLALRPMVRASCAAWVLVVAAGVRQSGHRGLGGFSMGPADGDVRGVAAGCPGILICS